MIIQDVVRKRVIEICQFYKNQATSLMMILSDVQNEFGYIPLEIQEIISNEINIPVSEIYGVITFFSFFSIVPRGKNIIQVCIGTTCYAKGSQKILEKILTILKLKKVGETTSDNLFTIDTIYCIGSCAAAPVIKINNKIFPNVKLDDIPVILKEYQK